ncbi:multicopper oxidase family protein [Streptomyces sp. NPDC048664]|uniref:multicopper oxidase family protein n=1 Tax=Streptomyces sp. NPDC048664 TaxID=3154505 RepID=UPI0034386FEA
MMAARTAAPPCVTVAWESSVSSHARRTLSVFGPALLALALAAGCKATPPTDVPGRAGPSPTAPWAMTPSPALTARATEDLRDPPEIVSRGGLLRTRIVVERKKVFLAGRVLWALTYNGLYMPPTLRLRPGDRMEIEFDNRLEQRTNLHVHGLHVSPGGAADNVFLDVQPGKTFTYSYTFPKDLAPGTYWYHPHPHGLSTAQTAGGMSGLIVVDGLDRFLPASLRGVTEHVVALKDFQLLGDQIKTLGLKMSAPTTRTVDGQLNPRIHIRPGETQLWRIANIGANIFYKVALPGTRLHVVAQDGFPVNKVYAADSLVVPAGARYDVLVQGPRAGTSELVTLPFSSGRAGSKAGNQFPRATLATVESGGTPVRAAALPTRFAPVTDLGTEPVAGRKTITFTENRAGTAFFINGRQFDHHRVDFRSRLGTVEEWTIRNDSDEIHSFHVHTNNFQVMRINGERQTNHGLQDTVDVPPRGTMVIRIRFLDYTGTTVLHCHIMNHEDSGMMSVLRIDK